MRRHFGRRARASTADIGTGRGAGRPQRAKRVRASPTPAYARPAKLETGAFGDDAVAGGSLGPGGPATGHPAPKRRAPPDPEPAAAHPVFESRF